MTAADQIRLRGESVGQFYRHCQGQIGPGILTGAEIQIVHPGGVVGGRAFQLQTLGTLCIGVPAGVNEEILAPAARVQMQLVGMAVAAAHAAAVEPQPGRLGAREARST